MDYKSTCKSCFNDIYRKSDPLENRKRHVKRYYGLDWIDYEQMYAEQEGRCKLCLTEMLLYEKDKLNVAHVDHDHETGKVRALLCHFCNSRVGISQGQSNAPQKSSGVSRIF